MPARSLAPRGARPPAAQRIEEWPRILRRGRRGRDAVGGQRGAPEQLDLTLGIAFGSCIQIALFVAPLLVLASYAVAPQPLSLSFSRAELGALFLAILIGAVTSSDGKGTGSKASNSSWCM